MTGTRGPRLLAVVVVAVIVSAAAAACDTNEPSAKTITTTDYLGKSVRDLFGQLGYIPNGSEVPNGFGIVTYEMGPPITKKPSLPNPGGLDTDWLTVVTCYSDTPEKQLTLGLLPMSDATPQIVATARARGYDRFVTECPGTSTTFTYPPDG